MDGIIDNSIKIVNGVETATISEEVRQAVDTIIDSAVERVEQQMGNITLSEDADVVTPAQITEGGEIDKVDNIKQISETVEVAFNEPSKEEDEREEIVEEQGKNIEN